MKKALLVVVAVLMTQWSFACTAGLSVSAYPSGSTFLQYYFGNTSSYGTIPSGYHKLTTYNYGDGYVQTVTGTSYYTMHTYASTGSYTAKIVIAIVDSTSGTIYCADSTTSSVTVAYPACADSIYVSYGTGGSVTFTAHNPAGTTGISRYWTFGDGGTGTGTPITHTYTYNGTYTVYLQDTNSTIPCTYVNSATITVTSGSWNCSLDTARLYTSGSGPYISFYSTTRAPSGVAMRYKWDFGDGSSILTTTAYYTSHYYSSAGTYTAKVVTLWVDTSTSSILCSDSTTRSVTVAALSCANDTARFSTTGMGYTISFYSPSRPPAPILMRYTWYYGDGSSYSSYSYSTSHTYSSSGTYTAKLVTQWYDTSSSTYLCADSITHSVTTGWSCSLDTARFYVSGSGYSWTFYATTRPPSGVSMRYKWNFGDGSTYTGSYYTSHSYSSGGTYTVKLVTEWYDSATSSVVCSDSITHSVTSSTPPNTISGYIFKDTSYSPTTADYKIWLITYDTASHIITAVDSMLDTGTYYTYYQFNSVPSGNYLIKAAITNGPTSGTAYVPSYHYNSPIWSTATYVNYSSGAVTGVNIVMQHGTVTGGPGFIGGDVRYGAGKATGKVGDPVKNLLVMVQDGSGNLVASAYTDAAGHYSITGLPLGSYTVYPEQLGLNTTAWSSVSLNAVKVGVTTINFKETSTAIKPDVTAIGNIPNSQSFTVYPNPNNGKVTIQWDNTLPGAAIINISSVTGQVVYTTKLNLDKSGRTELNLSELQQGIYFMNIESGDDHYYQKLVIQR